MSDAQSRTGDVALNLHAQDSSGCAALQNLTPELNQSRQRSADEDSAKADEADKAAKAEKAGEEQAAG